jgi:purine-binding chemotaxis protein CheW
MHAGPIQRRENKSAESTKDILRARAKALASEPPAPDSGGSVEVVEFLLAQERYAIESIHIREVYPLRDLTPIPCTPVFVSGIINVRGEIITVIDLRKFFDLAVSGLTDLNKVIILQSGEMQIGILADSILGIRSLVLRQLQPVLPPFTGMRADYLRGLTDQRVIVLDTERLLSDQRIVVNQEVEV